MKEAVEKLFAKMNEDNQFAEKILTQTEKEKVIELAKEEGIKLILEDIDEANALIKKSVEKQQAEGELSEDDLENVAGGVQATFPVTVIATVAITITGGITVAAPGEQK